MRWTSPTHHSGQLWDGHVLPAGRESEGPQNQDEDLEHGTAPPTPPQDSEVALCPHPCCPCSPMPPGVCVSLRSSPTGSSAPLAGTRSVSTACPQRWVRVGAPQTCVGMKEAGREGRNEGNDQNIRRDHLHPEGWARYCKGVHSPPNQSRTSINESLNPIGLFMEVDDRVCLEDKTRRRSQDDDPQEKQRRGTALPARKAKATFNHENQRGPACSLCLQPPLGHSHFQLRKLRHKGVRALAQGSPGVPQALF